MRLTLESRRQGSVTLEYIIVSTFAAVLSLSAIAFVGKIAKTKIASISEKIGVSAEEFEIDYNLDE